MLCTAIGYSSEGSLSASELLEEGVYLQEAKGDLEAAITRYKQVIELDANNRPRAAEAQYRLAVCYLEQGNEALAIQAFEALARDFPRQTKWVEAALEHLPREFEPNFIPWVDGERTEMEFRLANGDAVGVFVFDISEFEHEGRSWWKFSNRQFARGFDMMDSVIADPDSGLPLEGHYYDTNSGSVIYSCKERLVRIHYEKNDNKREFAIEGRFYSNSHAIALMRQFPAEVGFSTEQKVLVPLSGVVVPVVFKIIAIETLDTAIGTFECYQTELDIMGQKQKFWITNDAKRKMVKMAMGGIEVVVTRFGVAAAEAKTVYENDRIGYTVAYSNHWFSFESNVDEENSKKGRLELRDPNSTTSISIAAVRYESTENEESLSDLERVRETAEKHIKAYKQRSPDFEVDPESWSEFEINGATALSYVGRYVSATRGKPTVNKKTFVYGKGRRLIFTIRSPFDEIERMFPLFDAMVASVKIE